MLVLYCNEMIVDISLGWEIACSPRCATGEDSDTGAVNDLLIPFNSLRYEEG